MHALERWRERWMAAGLPVIPIKANSKAPVFDTSERGWLSTGFDAQWREVGGALFRGNIATVLGNGFAVLDADNQQAADAISAHLAGMGISSPVVQTVSGGRHYWLRLSDAPADVSYKLLSPEVGAGELRVSNCYVLVPCSAIGEQRYRFEFGSPEQIASMRSVRWADLLTLLPSTAAGERIESLPVRLLRREMPGRAVSLFEMLRDAPQSAPVDGMRYASRSEAEAAIMALLILSGWQLDEIFGVFEAEQPGHYADAKQSRRYLELTYRNVLSDIASTPERAQLAELYSQAQQWQWQGRGGLLSLAVYRAIIAIGWQFASYTINASERDIAEHASASKSGVRSALERLSEFGLVRRIQPGDTHKAALWQINCQSPPQYATISHSIKQKKGKDDTKKSSSSDVSELWGIACLGRSAGVVYSRLSAEGISIAQLAVQTGKSWATVRAALRRLAQHDLAVCSSDGLWCIGDAQISSIAEDFGTAHLAERRHERHEREREAWRMRLAAADEHKQLHRSHVHTSNCKSNNHSKHSYFSNHRKHSNHSRRSPCSQTPGKMPVFEPALYWAEQAHQQAEQYWLAGGDLPGAAPMREQQPDMPRAPDKPIGLCPVCGGNHWAQAAPGLRWRCLDCQNRKKTQRISSDITPEQAERLMALLQRFEREMDEQR